MSNSTVATVNHIDDHSADKGNRHRLPNLQSKLEKSASGYARKEPRIRASTVKLILLVSIILALLSFILKILVDYTGNELAKAGHSTNTELRQINIGADEIWVPDNMIRYPSQRKSASAARLDLFMSYPSFQGYSDQLRPVYVSENISSSILFVTLAPRFSELGMSDRLEPIYKKFFVNKPQKIGYDLVAHELDSDQGFINEYMIVEQSANVPFAARCIRKSDQNSYPYCIRDIPMGNNLSLTYRFHADLIPHWKEIEDTLRGRFSS